MDGRAIGIAGLAICMILCGSGSAFGLFKTGTSAAGVLAEDGKKFSKIIVLSLLPATQGIYGFVLAVMNIPEAGIAAAEGWAIFWKAFGMGVTGMLSAVLQGAAAAACIYAVGKNSAGSGKYVLFPAMIEFYAILALVLGIMM